MRTLVIATAVALAAPVARWPNAYADAHLGRLLVTSGVEVSAKGVVLRGSWQDRTLPCSLERKLSIRARVSVTPPGGPPRRITLSRGFEAPNCAAPIPSDGFTLTPKMLLTACANGSWRPGRYRFVTTTTEPTRNLEATARLQWSKTGRC